jgi:prepilin-type N-terminal cleavage/methylation domain-containing protein/prepilin-type processing-associated H-X9-DG protein
MRTKRRGFTLVELLVVIGIIAVLIALLMPTLGKVRQSAQRTACRASLRDIGQRFQMYLQQSHQLLPLVNILPSQQPPLNGGPSLVDLLEPYGHPQKQSYRCPSDHFIVGAPNGFETYFDREGSSYQYQLLPFAGMNVADKRIYPRNNATADRVRVIEDYEAFHDLVGANDAMNVLYLDGHVSDLTDR